ncbi:MAG: M6 family metalloprotease domain-containing protein [Bacteroidales bacterium]|nr:M6 family metalloprotease domain-containing protein [Bacteroidales bacterium]
MKRFLLLTATALSMLLPTPQDTFFTPAQAAPALRRIVTLTQPDGSTLQALPMGDEHMSYWIEAQTGHLLTQDATTHVWRRMNDAEVQENDVRWQKSRREAAKLYGVIRRIGGVKPSNQVKLPVLLVEFADVKLTDEFGTVEYTNKMLNDLNYDHVAYTTNGKDYHVGSIRKYWNIQSLKKFDPQFEVLGKITLSQNRSVYGKDSGSSIDTNIRAFYKEVVDSVKQQGLLEQASLYDHNGDGVLDCLYIIYAGYGQNELADQTDLIWAKNHSGNVYTLNDGTKTNLFLLSPELFGRGKSELHPNIGVFTHEFGHSIGLPDFYGTNSSTRGQCYGMDSWSLMDQGEYNGRGQIPSSLTTHERMYLGWLDEPATIDPNSKDTLGLFVSTGDARIFRNPDNENEYITIENHQPENEWEITWGNSTYYGAHTHEGLLITYVNFDQALWNANSPNNDPSFQRCSPISADGDRRLYINEEITTQAEYDAWRINLSSDIYPGASNIRKLNSENLLFRWHNGDTIAFNINDIEQLTNRSIVITFGEPATTSIKPITDNTHNGRAIKRLQNGQIFIEKDGAYYDLLGRKVNAQKR